MRLGQRLLAEGLGTAFLLAAVVGSGIMGERLAAGNEAIVLLANALATGAALFVILLAVGPVSGAHLNPVVTVVLAARGELPIREIPWYVLVQVIGAILGVWATHAMFGLPVIEVSTKVRTGGPLAWSEFVATCGLLATVLMVSRSRPESVPAAVATYITAAYWFTSSTSFANPAASLGRAMTDTFVGIRPVDVAGFIAAQAGAAIMAILLLRGRSSLESRPND